MAFINGIVSGFYHPMATLGDRLYAMRMGAIIIPILVSITMLILWVRRRPLRPRIYAFGLVPLGLAAVLPLLPRVDSGYEQSYWLGDQRYSIPWMYAPYNGQSQPGGRYFLIKVVDLKLTPYYQSVGDAIIAGKATDYAVVDEDLRDACETDRSSFNCVWESDGAVYWLRGDAIAAPKNPDAVWRLVEALFDGFERDGSASL